MGRSVAETLIKPFVWGAGGAALTPEELAKRREQEAAALGKIDMSPVYHPLQGLARVAEQAAGAFRRGQLDSEQTASDDYNQTIVQGLLGGASSGGSSIPMTGAAGEVAATAPAQPIDITGNDVYSGFMDTVKAGGVTNPYALAAIAATGKAESGFSPQNATRTWSDPSESGQAGTAGGILSWRGPRYQALAATGDLSPAGQARFFLGENPQLIQALQNAGSVEEAQSLMNNAWKFAGYNRPGGEAARRLGYASSFLPSFQGSGQVAATDPQQAFSAVMPELGATPSLSDEVAEFRQTPEYAAAFPGAAAQQFDAGRFGDETPITPVQGEGGLATALAASNQDAAGQQAIVEQPNAIPQQFQGSQQLVGANGGIAPALMEGQPASSQQVAQALALGQQPQRSQINPAILRALADPRANAQTRGVAELLLKQSLADQQAEADRSNWLFQRQYQEQAQARDPLRQAQIEAMRRKAQGLDDAAKVQSSTILDDGSAVLVMNNGQRRVIGPSGEEVTGQAAADAIRSAREYTVQNQRDIYGGRRAGTLGSDIQLGGAAKAAEKVGEASVKAGMDAWSDYGKLRTNISNIDDAIGALDAGAKSGAVYNMLPNVTEASASLKNAMDRMGLDVIGSVTFGALSEGEMNLAMDTAVPRNLGSEQLRSWLVKKREAQQKAADMLADAAQFLTVPGNTINDWIAKNRSASSSSGALPRGGRVGGQVNIGGYTIEQVD